MMLTKEQAKKNLIKLVEKYQEVANQDRIKDFNEEATKTAFIQPLLKDVLGWDVNDYNEVSPEERISRGRVDYCLKIDNKPKIFVEAKPLKAELSRHIEQAVHYGYNRKGVPFVLLTDFEEIKLFDVTLKPDIKNPKKGLKLDLYWKWYEDNFDKLWQLSKESVISGELDKLLLAKPKDRIPVDKAILVDLEDWRESLAKDIYKNNPHLFHSATDLSLRATTGSVAISNLTKSGIASVVPLPRNDNMERNAEYLKEITQRILDRIIFMRFCEDRQFIHGQTLKELFEDRTEQVGTTTMVFLEPKFKQFDITFDSDLFSHKEWENDLQIDFRVMNKIVLDTYNPYQFDVIPLEVLGNIYEQYLGYTIRLTPQMVKYELKPEVRKAGGVYYTPEYIVDYIVKNTVGKLLKEATPQKIKKIRILDPACGSGSFLIRAYEEMLNYYKEQKKKQKPRMDTDKHRNVGQGFSLANSESKPKGSPYEDTIQKELDLKHTDSEVRLTIHEKAEILKNHIFGVDIDEQAVEVTKLSLMLKMLEGEFGIIPGRNILPMLDKNIRCGNSLISGSPIELKKYFGDDYYKVGFNWEEEFKDIFKDGGFDVVIGNPPYNASLTSSERTYLLQEYNFSKGNLNSANLFIERGCKIAKRHGYIGLIVPKSLCYSSDWKISRQMILADLEYLVDVSRAFPEVLLEQVVFVLHKGSDLNNVMVGKVEEGTLQNTYFIKKKIFEFFDVFLTITNAEMKIGLKIRENCPSSFSEIASIKRGQDIQQYLSESEFRKIYRCKSIGRYLLKNSNEGITSEVYKILKNTINYMEMPKIVIQNIIAHVMKPTDHIIIMATLDNEGIIGLGSIGNIFIADTRYDKGFLIGIINSKLISWYAYRFIYGNAIRTMRFDNYHLARLPLRVIDFNKQTDKKLHDEVVALVDVMLDLNKKIQTAKGNAKEQIQREIDKTDRNIDDLVYKLYGITEEEKKIIEVRDETA